VGGVKLPLALAKLGLIDEYEFIVHPRLGEARADVVGGTIGPCRLEAERPVNEQV
jgi:hypothetical protein